MSNERYLARPYQPYFGFGDCVSVSQQQDLEQRGLLPRGYRFNGRHYCWNASADHSRAAIGDFLYEHYLSRYLPQDVDAVERTRRLFVIGGSLAVGSSASTKENSWHAVLERTLCQEFPLWAPCVFNCAMGAFVSTQELLTLLFTVLPKNPYAVIFLNGLNDIFLPWSLGTRPGDPYNLSTVMKYWYERAFVHGQSEYEAEESLRQNTR